MPVLLLPTCLPLSVAELLVPALTEMQVAGEHERVRRSVREMLGKTFLLSLGAAAAFFVFARPLGMLLYGSAEAARFLRLLAPMVPFLSYRFSCRHLCHCPEVPRRSVLDSHHQHLHLEGSRLQQRHRGIL